MLQLLPGEDAVEPSVSALCLQAGEGDVALLGPELDHYIQGKDQYECTPLHIAILQGKQQPPAPTENWPSHITISCAQLAWHGTLL